jgi:hypothetical protein
MSLLLDTHIILWKERSRASRLLWNLFLRGALSWQEVLFQLGSAWFSRSADLRDGESSADFAG